MLRKLLWLAAWMAVFGFWTVHHYGWTADALGAFAGPASVALAWIVTMQVGRALLVRRVRRTPRLNIEDATRDRLAMNLGVGTVLREDDTYRTTSNTSLDGDWLGGFMQPGVVLNGASGVRMTIGNGAGRSNDEYGEAQLAIAKQDADRAELDKQYTNESAGPLRYVGRLANGTFAGYWYKVSHPGFCGLFWFARAERLSDEGRRAFESRIRSRSWRRALVKLLMLALVSVTIGAAFTKHPLVLFAGVAVWAAANAVYQLRAMSLGAEVARWKGTLEPRRGESGPRLHR